MNRDELLTKLAMEWRAWPDFNNGEAPTPNAPGVWYTNLGQWMCSAHNDPLDVSERNWLDRRAELINEPDDTDAPEWARWKAQDSDGEWFWFAGEPEMQQTAWVHGEQPHRASLSTEGKIPAGHDWRTTLREVMRDMSENEPAMSRNEPQYDPSDVAFNRQINPPTSSLADSQAITVALATGVCSDGFPCDAMERCDDCPNAPHAQDSRRLDEQLAADMRQQCADKINPSHYRNGEIECIDAIKAATVGKTGIEAACVANVIKYLWRYESKNGIEDIEKALWYLNRLHDEVHD